MHVLKLIDEKVYKPCEVWLIAEAGDSCLVLLDVVVCDFVDCLSALVIALIFSSGDDMMAAT